ncbi:hypothetical protein D2962_10325 [Biomaibacter acetigenes]|uniref:Uncharacterized protein n=1 Tax=Biomaibacter acetigenes TaxID=2316383 RepID=A0A3G2R6B6_9FIRM|nr:hypothetical protein [Biomaibacter acetigenes]AYO30951.1 hypothetical protein D2962_10325 [Biomaibacter acetigenes]RKL61889.1 hypothetical protein DXT63_14410 [Thermoanaerobacteraceae bacterium SP2]
MTEAVILLIISKKGSKGVVKAATLFQRPEFGENPEGESLELAFSRKWPAGVKMQRAGLLAN